MNHILSIICILFSLNLKNSLKSQNTWESLNIKQEKGLQLPQNPWELDLQSFMKRTILSAHSNAPIEKMTLLIASPSQKIKWQLTTEKMANGVIQYNTADQTIQIASITKMLTASVILKLNEQKQLKLNNSIKHYLPDIIMTKLLLWKGESIGNNITILDLLRHTSGLKDYVFDNPAFLPYIFENPNHNWTPIELLNSYLTSELPQSPIAAPSTNYYYSDTNYLLLGLIIEKICNQPLHKVYRDLLFDPLGIRQSFLKHHENQPDSSISIIDCWYGELKITSINTSFDWGAGGLVMPLHELYNFAHALFSGDLFSDKGTLQTFLSGVDTQEEGFDLYEYGCGVNIVKIPGFPLIQGHSGFYGSFLYYVPGSDLYILGSLNQSQASIRNTVKEIIRILMKNEIVSE